VQFTPDLMPADIIGTDVLEEDKATGSRQVRFLEGPLFANVVLADEINRTPPKTQAALLEAMQERQVSVGRVRHRLVDPFFVLATQNPIEQEGTYPLPEAQQDRFMFKVFVRYPTFDEEFEIARRTTGTPVEEPRPVLSAEDILTLQRSVREVPVSDHLVRWRGADCGHRNQGAHSHGKPPSCGVNAKPVATGLKRRGRRKVFPAAQGSPAGTGQRARRRSQHPSAPISKPKALPKLVGSISGTVVKLTVNDPSLLE
jgi:MoxR-like ATPase